MYEFRSKIGFGIIFDSWVLQIFIFSFHMSFLVRTGYTVRIDTDLVQNPCTAACCNPSALFKSIAIYASKLPQIKVSPGSLNMK